MIDAIEDDDEEPSRRRPDFQVAFFSHDASEETQRGYARYERAVVAELMLTTGRIVATDGLIPSLVPFTQEVKPGLYPVVHCYAHLENGDCKIACAMLRFRNEEPAHWKLARLQENEDFPGCYGVDCGVGCFADLAAMASLVDAGPTGMRLRDRVHASKTLCVFELDQGTGLNIVVFSSGYGDGVYPSYFGYNDDGDVACLATDFGIILRLTDQEPLGEGQMTLEF